MLRVERVRVNDGSGNAVIDFQASTVSDLPTKGASFGSLKVCAGSIAQIIQTGVFATLDEDGKWYADGSEVS